MDMNLRVLAKHLKGVITEELRKQNACNISFTVTLKNSACANVPTPVFLAMNTSASDAALIFTDLALDLTPEVCGKLDAAKSA